MDHVMCPVAAREGRQKCVSDDAAKRVEPNLPGSVHSCLTTGRFPARSGITGTETVVSMDAMDGTMKMNEGGRRVTLR